VPGLGCNDDTGAAAGDDVAKLLEDECRTVEIDLEDRRRGCLAGGDTGRMNQAGDIAERRGLLD